MNTKTLISILLAAILAGCLPSLHPLYTDNDLIFDPNLLGCFSDKQTTWLFEQSPQSKTYNLTLTTDNKQGRFDARLVKIDNLLFLDLYPQDPGLTQNDFYKMHLLPIHSFIRIDQIDPNLKMAMVEHDKLDKMLKADPNIIKHERTEGELIVLTASTEQLQAFMKKYAADNTLFSQSDDFAPCSPAEPNDPNKPASPL